MASKACSFVAAFSSSVSSLSKKKIAAIESGRKGVEEACFFVERICKGVRCSGRNNNIVSSFGIYIFLTGNVEPHSSLGDEERFIVHDMPMRWWSFNFCGGQ